MCARTKSLFAGCISHVNWNSCHSKVEVLCVSNNGWLNMIKRPTIHIRIQAYLENVRNSPSSQVILSQVHSFVVPENDIHIHSDESGFLDEPADESGFLEGPADESGFLDEPADESGFLNEPADESGFLDEQADESGFLDEPADESGYLDG